ncbi:hypothetical protein QT970_19185 [Microcoleus sp. herbarium8]|uniref:hypothetical protein n=1 Tax=Microcoleus sp. herbarium8 TaxID=3055436 RepID=UPI002FD04CCE
MASASIAFSGFVRSLGIWATRAGFESRLKNFDFWGTISETQKSGEPESTEKSQLSYSLIVGDRTWGRSTVTNDWGAISQS